MPLYPTLENFHPEVYAGKWSLLEILPLKKVDMAGEMAQQLRAPTTLLVLLSLPNVLSSNPSIWWLTTMCKKI